MKQTKIACTLAAALTLGCLALPYGGSVSAEEADDAVAIAETAESSAVDSSEDSLISEDDLNSEESAETFTSGDYTYTLTTQGTVCLTKYSGSDTAGHSGSAGRKGCYGTRRRHFCRKEQHYCNYTAEKAGHHQRFLLLRVRFSGNLSGSGREHRLYGK